MTSKELSEFGAFFLSSVIIAIPLITGLILEDDCSDRVNKLFGILTIVDWFFLTILMINIARGG